MEVSLVEDRIMVEFINGLMAICIDIFLLYGSRGGEIEREREGGCY